MRVDVGGVCENMYALSAAMTLINAVMQVLACLCAWGWGYVWWGVWDYMCIVCGNDPYNCRDAGARVFVCVGMGVCEGGVCGCGCCEVCIYLCTNMHCSTAVTLTIRWLYVGRGMVAGVGLGGVYICVHIYVYIYICLHTILRRWQTTHYLGACVCVLVFVWVGVGVWVGGVWVCIYMHK